MPQFIANTVLVAATILLVGLGFGLIYRITRFFHIAHGAVFTVGAYSLYVLNTALHLDLALAVPVAVAVAALVGLAIDRAVHLPLRRRDATSVVHLIASLGLYVAATNLLSLGFGGQTLTLRRGQVAEGISLLGARLTPIQLTIICCSVAAVILTVLLGRLTNSGLFYRAVATDSDLARVTGIEVDTVISGSFLFGSALVGLAGALMALDVDLRPTMGLSPLLLAVVAVIVGGPGSTGGLLVGALLISTIQGGVGWAFGQEWREPAAFAALLVFLVLRPRGVRGVTVTEHHEP